MLIERKRIHLVLLLLLAPLAVSAQQAPDPELREALRAAAGLLQKLFSMESDSKQTPPEAGEEEKDQ